MNQHNGEETILVEALRLPLQKRSAYLDQITAGNPALRQRVESLLDSYQAGDFLERAPTTFGGEFRACILVPEKPGDKIGPYKILQKIGEGGCGTVYMAEQEKPVCRRVAVKIIKLGMDTKNVIARFEAERQALAMMDHPNIAKVFDAGATETGRPYFVMELVRGVRITDYCDEQKLPTRQRLDLFTQVCQAVQHAHQKGVIHRDIKPSNILVTINDGVAVPKVIDFGIAKATGGHRLTEKTLVTAFEQFIGTPAYMSPEQALMTSLDIDTRSDIYALGVLLYELLTGQTPFDSKALLAIGLDEMRRTIREKEPERPSTRLSTLPEKELSTTAHSRGLDAPKLISRLRGDLDWIVMKCLEKDRARRYETANGLAMDIQRHLNEEPVMACPPSPLYRFQKMVRRNKLAFVAASAVLSALIIGLTVSTILFLKENAARVRELAAETQMQRALADAKQQRDSALKQKQRADEQAAVAKSVKDFLQNDLLMQADSEMQANLGFEQRPDLTVKEALRRASEKIGQSFTNQPLVEAEIRNTIGSAFSGVGEAKLAIPHLERAVALDKQIAGPDHPDTLRTVTALAAAYEQAGRWTEAVALYEEALRLQKTKLGPDHPDSLTTMEHLAWAYRDVGRLAEAVQMDEETLKLCKARFGPDHPSTLKAMSSLALVYERASRIAEALALCEEALKLQKTKLGPDHPDTLRTRQQLAWAYAAAGRLAESIQMDEETLKLQKSQLGPDHPDTLKTMNQLASAYWEEGQQAEGLRLYAETLALAEKSSGNLNPVTATARVNLGIALKKLGKAAEAEAVYRPALQASKNLGDGDSSPALWVGWNLMDLLREQGKLAAEGLVIYKELPDTAHHLKRLFLAEWMVRVLPREASGADAEKQVSDALGLPRESLSKDATFLSTRGEVFARRGQWQEAISDLKRAMALNPEDDEVWHALAVLMVRSGQFEAYRDHCCKSVERFEHSKDHSVADGIAKDCLILPESGADLQTVARMAETAGMAMEGFHVPWSEFCRALAEYRQGRFARAVDLVGKVLAKTEEISEVDIEAYIVVAMAYQRLNQPDKAKAALAKGSELAETKLPKLETGDLGERWREWIIIHTLLREAKALIESEAVLAKDVGK
jgi:serine/threonine protein kinase/tetratricopeptide (TPR) repeat protein